MKIRDKEKADEVHCFPPYYERATTNCPNFGIRCLHITFKSLLNIQFKYRHPRIIFPLKKWQNYCRERNDFQIAMPGWRSMALRYNLGSMLT